MATLMMMMMICRALYQALPRKGDHRRSHIRLTRHSYIINKFVIIIIIIIIVIVIVIVINIAGRPKSSSESFSSSSPQSYVMVGTKNLQIYA